jgi:hypothetical protein
MKKLVLAGLVAVSVFVGNVSAGDGQYVIKEGPDKYGDYKIVCKQSGYEYKISNNGQNKWSYTGGPGSFHDYSADEAAKKACS